METIYLYNELTEKDKKEIKSNLSNYFSNENWIKKNNMIKSNNNKSNSESKYLIFLKKIW